METTTKGSGKQIPMIHNIILEEKPKDCIYISEIKHKGIIAAFANDSIYLLCSAKVPKVVGAGFAYRYFWIDIKTGCPAEVAFDATNGQYAIDNSLFIAFEPTISAGIKSFKDVKWFDNLDGFKAYIAISKGL